MNELTKVYEFKELLLNDIRSQKKARSNPYVLEMLDAFEDLINGHYKEYLTKETNEK